MNNSKCFTTLSVITWNWKILETESEYGFWFMHKGEGSTYYKECF